MTWYDKLALAGIAVFCIGWIMFMVGIWSAIDANRQTRAALRSAVEQGDRR